MSKPLPTDAELQILRVLWSRGPSTVATVLECLPSERDVGYTTVLKLLQIMLEKGLVARDESARAHVYRAEVGEGDTRARLVRRLAERAFGGSAARLALHALATEPASPEEREEIRDLLRQMEEEG